MNRQASPSPVPKIAPTAIDPAAADFATFVAAVEPELRKALVGTFGYDAVGSLVEQALDHAWRRWPIPLSAVDALPEIFAAVYVDAAKPLLVDLVPADVPPPDAVAADVTQIQGIDPRLPGATAHVDEPHRTAVWLTQACGWSVSSVARALDRGIPTIGSHVGAALGVLRPFGSSDQVGEQLARLGNVAFGHTKPVIWEPSRHERSTARGWKTPALLVAAVVIGAAILGPRLATTPTFGIPTGDQTADSQASGQPAAAQEPATPAPGEPTAVPTPVPTAPAVQGGRFVGDAQIIGDRLVVVDSNEVWLSSDRAGSWQRLAYPKGAVYDPYSSCFSAIGDRLVVSTIGSGSRKLFVEQPDQRSWDVITVPAAPERANWYWGNRLCRPIDVDGTWTLATTERDGLRIASTSDGGETFVQHQILFPPEWIDVGTDFGLGGFVNLYRDKDWIVAQVCIARSGSDCPSQEVTFHKSLLAPGTQGEVAHDTTNTDGQPMLSWNESGRTYTEEIELFQFDSTVWRTEVDPANAGPADTTLDTWASGPFDGPLTPLPGRPSLFSTADGVVACVENGDECWIRSVTDVDWRPLTESPQVDWRTLPLGTQATFSELAADGTVLVVPYGIAS